MDVTALDIERSGDVLIVRMAPAKDATAAGQDQVTAIGDAVAEASKDRSIRVIVLTGAADGEFLVTPPVSHYSTGAHEQRITGNATALNMTPRIVRTFRAMLDAPQPIVARVNGDAIGFGQSLVYACDLVVAWEDAVISDVHLGLGTVESREGVKVGPPFGVMPGDGAIAFAGSYMTPSFAKEYFMLSTSHLASELAQLKIINHAVAHGELDATVDRLTAALVERPGHILAMTKKLLNTESAARIDTHLMAANALEAVHFQVARHT